MRYTILVRGAVSDRFCQVFEKMVATRQGATTEIAGDVADSAQLCGVLGLLAQQGNEILSLTQTDTTAGERDPSGIDSEPR